MPDTAKDTRFTDKVDRLTGFSTRSVMAVPIKFHDTVYGVIELINRTSGGLFTDMEHLILRTIADFAGIAFAHSALYEQALHLGNTDPLTGVNNRARLNEIINEAEKSGDKHRRRYDRESYLVAVMVDIDNFKAINDSYSHRQGDKVLKKTASLMRSCVRGDDTIFRIGGDEFLMLLNEPVSDNLERIIERVKGDMAKISSFSVGKDIHVVFSYGVASGPMHKISEIIHQSDLAMYRKKQDG